MQREKISSSAIASAGYDWGKQILELEYAGGAVYRYFGVGPRVWAAFARAPSKGRFVNYRIKGAYRYRLVRQGPCPPQPGRPIPHPRRRGSDRRGSAKRAKAGIR
ncbi:MAG: KTSC domain-containing protein [Rhizobiales bacterium]|nr:KTSC domain-containing protein [Hyphomicrobiales bacterium]